MEESWTWTGHKFKVRGSIHYWLPRQSECGEEDLGEYSCFT